MVIGRRARELGTREIVERVAMVSTIVMIATVKRMLGKIDFVVFGEEGSLSLVLAPAGP